MVESEFRQGKFTQMLECVRPPQEGDSKAQVAVAYPVSGTAAGNNGPLNGGGGSVRTTSGGTPESTSTDITIPRATAGAGSSSGVSSGAFAITDDDGNKLVVNGDSAILKDATGNLTRTQLTGASDRPGPDPLTQAVRDNAATVDDYENAGMSSGSDFPTPDAASADPNQALLRNVAQNGPTATIDTNSDDSGESIVGASSASTQTAAPPQPAPVVNEPVTDPAATTQQSAPVTQTPPVQTPPQAEPASAAQRQSTAALAQLNTLNAQNAAVDKEYQTTSAQFRDLNNQYSRIGRIVNNLQIESLNLDNSPELRQKYREQFLERQAYMREFDTGTLEPVKVRLRELDKQKGDILDQIDAIKANATNENAELNAALDAVDARQRATTTF